MMIVVVAMVIVTVMVIIVRTSVSQFRPNQKSQ